MNAPTQKQSETLTPCWYVKDLADGWIKFYDVDMAIAEAKASGAIMCYSENGAYPDRAQPSETPVAEKVRDAGTALDMIFQIMAAHCENMDVDMPDDEDEALLEGCKAEIKEALALLDQQDAPFGGDKRVSAVKWRNDITGEWDEVIPSPDAPKCYWLINQPDLEEDDDYKVIHTTDLDVYPDADILGEYISKDWLIKTLSEARRTVSQCTTSEYCKAHNAACDTIIAEIEKMMGAK